MNPQPTVFISSIISEFSDLRGALRYFLAKNGFRVLMSEEPDFGVNCNQDSLPTCKKQIEKSDYLIILIGNEPGTVFSLSENETTVTREEFRHYLHLNKNGKSLHLIVFVRSQTWDNYDNKDFSKIDRMQANFINEILESAEDKILGRWRYTFKTFTDIVTVLESNQNKLFVDTTRKQSLYKSYLKKEFLEIYRLFFNMVDNELMCITDIVKLPDINFNGELIDQQRIDGELAGMIMVLIGFFQKKVNLVQKIQRIFIYIAQGEFSYFDTENQKYVQPEFIKMAIQVGELIEKLVHNFTNIDIYDNIKNRFIKSEYIYTISRAEYNLFVKSSYSDIKIIVSKLTNLVLLFDSNSTDFIKRDDDFYSYRGVIHDNIKESDLISYARQYFKK